jgi:hypothetical protein
MEGGEGIRVLYERWVQSGEGIKSKNPEPEAVDGGNRPDTLSIANRAATNWYVSLLC